MGPYGASVEQSYESPALDSIDLCRLRAVLSIRSLSSRPAFKDIRHAKIGSTFATAIRLSRDCPCSTYDSNKLVQRPRTCKRPRGKAVDEE